MRELAEAINHHLRTPLAAMLGHAELLLDRRHELPSPLEGSAAGIVRAGLRLDDAVSVICDLVELACGCPGDVEPVDVMQLLSDEVATAWARWGSCGPRVTVSGRSGLVCTGDRERLGRAVRALLDHAMAHASEESEVRVTAIGSKDLVHISIRCTLRDDSEARATGARPPQASSDGGLALTLASAIAESYDGSLAFVDGTRGSVEARLELPVQR